MIVNSAQWNKNILTVYGPLFFLATVLINPFSADRGGIWVFPKLVIFGTITAANLYLLYGRAAELREAWKNFKLFWLLWFGFLFFGLVSTTQSPSPLRSFLAHDELRDGLLFWAALLVFVLSTAAVFRVHSGLFIKAGKWFVAGAVANAVAVFAQTIDWKLDFTTTSFETTAQYPEMLMSTIWKSQMPLGFLLHRAQVGYVMGFAALLLLPSAFAGSKKSKVLAAILFAGLGLAHTRAVLLAFACGFLLLLAQRLFLNGITFRKASAWVLGLAFFGMVITGALVMRLPSDFTFFHGKYAITSDRLEYWEKSLRLIQQRPLIGWGFNGYGIGAPTLERCVPSKGEKVVELLPYNFICQAADGSHRVYGSIASKAHNVFIDAFVALGLLGGMLWIALYVFALVLLARNGYGSIALYTFVYQLFWYDTAFTTPWFYLLAATSASRSAVRA